MGIILDKIHSKQSNICSKYIAKNKILKNETPKNEIEKYVLYCLSNDINISTSNIKNLSRNPNISWDFVCNHPEIEWSYQELSKNPNISLNIVKANPDKEWHYSLLVENISITWDDIQKDNRLLQCSSNFSKNPNITIDIIRKNPHIKWNYTDLSSNSSIKFEDIQLAKDIPWQTYGIITNPNTPIEYILSLNEHYGPDMTMFYYIFCENNNTITYDTICNNPNQHWQPVYLAKNPCITLDIVKSDQKRFKNANGFLSQNPNITWDVLQNNPDYQWEPFYIVQNPNITFDLLLADPDKKYMESIHNITTNIFKYNKTVYGRHIKQYILSSNLIIQDLKTILYQYVFV